MLGADFILAGNSIFTIENVKTGKRFTYKIKKCETQKDLYFVSLLTGENNNTDYTYIGVISNKELKKEFKLTKKSKLTFSSPGVLGINFLIQKLHKLNQIPNLNIYHEGRCGRCGRRLTTPESIKSGLGPSCIKKLGFNRGGY